MNNFLKFTRRFYFSYPCPRKLREIVQMSLFEKENKEVIKEIWQKHYETKPNIFGLDLHQEEMRKIVENGKANPFFVFPVRKSGGYYVLIAQSQDKSFIYTFLEDYKKNPSNSTPYLVITMFDELVFKKGVALVRGDIIGDLSKKEAETIFQLTKDFYLRDPLYENVKTFNRDSHKFKHDDHFNYCLKYFI